MFKVGALPLAVLGVFLLVLGDRLRKRHALRRGWRLALVVLVALNLQGVEVVAYAVGFE